MKVTIYNKKTGQKATHEPIKSIKSDVILQKGRYINIWVLELPSTKIHLKKCHFEIDEVSE